MNTQTPTVTSSKYTDLKSLIAQVESSNNQFAVRYESSYFGRVKNSDLCSRRWNCTFTTARFLLSCSWGLYQIMGENLVNLGLSESPIKYCNDRILQDAMFAQYCLVNHCDYSLSDIINNESKRIDFAKKYNGVGNFENYSNLLMGVYNELC